MNVQMKGYRMTRRMTQKIIFLLVTSRQPKNHNIMDTHLKINSNQVTFITIFYSLAFKYEYIWEGFNGVR